VRRISMERSIIAVVVLLGAVAAGFVLLSFGEGGDGGVGYSEIGVTGNAAASEDSEACRTSESFYRALMRENYTEAVDWMPVEELVQVGNKSDNATAIRESLKVQMENRNQAFQGAIAPKDIDSLECLCSERMDAQPSSEAIPESMNVTTYATYMDTTVYGDQMYGEGLLVKINGEYHGLMAVMGQASEEDVNACQEGR